MTWKDTARTVILRAVADARAQGLSAKATRELVEQRYPFGPRKYYPYRQWCVARRELLGTRDVPGTLERFAAWNAGEPIRCKDVTREEHS